MGCRCSDDPYIHLLPARLRCIEIPISGIGVGIAGMVMVEMEMENECGACSHFYSRFLSDATGVGRRPPALRMLVVHVDDEHPL